MKIIRLIKMRVARLIEKIYDELDPRNSLS